MSEKKSEMNFEGNENISIKNYFKEDIFERRGS